MPLTLPPDPLADSFVSVAEATIIASILSSISHLRVSATAWNSANNDTREAALKFAADSVSAFAFIGTPKDPDQRLAFPRLGTGLTWANDNVPDVVKQAQVAEACRMLTSPSEAEAAAAQGIQSFSFGQKSATLSGASADQVGSSAASRILANAGLLFGGRGGMTAVPNLRR